MKNVCFSPPCPKHGTIRQARHHNKVGLSLVLPSSALSGLFLTSTEKALGSSLPQFKCTKTSLHPSLHLFLSLDLESPDQRTWVTLRTQSSPHPLLSHSPLYSPVFLYPLPANGSAFFCSWYTVFYFIQRYNIVSRQLCTLQNVHHSKCHHHLCPYNVRTRLLTIFPVLDYSSPWMELELCTSESPSSVLPIPHPPLFW